MTLHIAINRIGKWSVHSTARGFTLIELMVTLAVATIILMVGIPSFQELVKNNRMTTAINSLVSALNLARSEAIKQGIRVTVCKSEDATNCTSSDGWEQGWIVFTDQNSNATYDSSSETLLRAHGAIDGQITMTGNTNVTDYISYVASGRSQLTGGGFQAGTITVCDDRSGNIGKNVVLSLTGRIRLDSGISCP